MKMRTPDGLWSVEVCEIDGRPVITVKRQCYVLTGERLAREARRHSHRNWVYDDITIADVREMMGADFALLKEVK